MTHGTSCSVCGSWMHYRSDSGAYHGGDGLCSGTPGAQAISRRLAQHNHGYEYPTGRITCPECRETDATPKAPDP